MAVFVIAEIGSVHDGSLGNALRLIDVAAECGADAAKFQTHIAEAETIASAPAPPYFTDEPRFDYFNRTSFTPEQWRKLREHCESKGIQFLSSPFSIEAVELLESIGMQHYKVPSGEITNLPLIERIANLKKPVLLSSGMSSWQELDRAVEAVFGHHRKLTVLQCTSEYPCSYDRVGLNVMQEMHSRYGVEVGLSDHSQGPYAVFAAVALGASVIEKHLTFSTKMYGSDAKYATEPEAFADLVRGIRAIERMLANPVSKDDVSRLRIMKDTFEKSLVTIHDLPSGTILNAGMLGCKKPGTGLSASRLSEVLGKKTSRPVKANVLLSADDIDWKS
jgi:N,N'-diacetyllegionaminate synthase